MALFRYRAFNESGVLSEAEMDAPDIGAVREKLWALGLTPFDVKEARDGRPARLFGQLWGARALGLREIAAFTREFATLEEADIPIDDGLRILCEQSGHKTTQRLAKELLDDVVDGTTLSDAMRRQPQAFSQEYVNVVHSGEMAGAIARVLADMADLLERRLDLQTRLRSALIYPAILMVLAIVSVAVVLSVLVPNIAPIFADSGRPMPDGLLAILWIEAHWLPIAFALAAIGATIFAVVRAASRRPALRLAMHRRYLSIPALGPLLAKRDIGQFARTLASLVRAGVPLLPAIESARATVANASIAAGLMRAAEMLRDGASLSHALDEVEHVPPLARRMIAIGEETGRLAAMLTQVAQTFENQVQQAIARAMSVLTPALTVAIAGLVGALILSVMTAILSINELAMK